MNSNLRHSLHFTMALALLAISAAAAGALTVTSAGDSGAGTLRQAILDNESSGGGNTIVFADYLTSVDGFIQVLLTTGPLSINQDVSIVGPGARLLALKVDANSPASNVINVNGGTVVISGLTITGGGFSSSTNYPGGGIINYGILTLNDCAITNNAGDPAKGAAGAIDNYKQLTINRCTIANNSGQYGAIFNELAGQLIASDSTIAKNTGTLGGGITILRNYSGVTILTGCTIVGNQITQNGEYGAGIRYPVDQDVGDHLQVGNCLVANNVTANGAFRDVLGSVDSQGYNLIGDSSGSSDSSGHQGFTATGDQTGTSSNLRDPMLGQLQNNGGPTDTMEPLPNSPAVDAGNSFGSTLDQRGRARVVHHGNSEVGDGADIGAVELQDPSNLIVSNKNNTGPGSLREAIANAASGDSVVFDLDVTGAIVTYGALVGSRNVNIVGPGADVLAVNGAGVDTVLDLEPQQNQSMIISGLSFVNGKTYGVHAGGSGGVIITHCAMSGNAGPGLFVDGAADVGNCTISDNQAVDGGGIDNIGKLLLTNCTIARNSASHAGGGIFIGGKVIGAAHTFVPGTLTATNCTISANTGNLGGGIQSNVKADSVTLQDTIIAGNALGGTNAQSPDLAGSYTSGGYNLIGIADASSGFTDGSNHDQVGSSQSPKDPKLDKLQNNGGPTNTMALLTGSPAIDAGNDAVAPTTDERGAARVGVSDIGAYELGSTPAATPTPGATATPPAQLLNISTRMKVLTGDNVLIGGFIVTGADQKKVLLRGLGPSLPLNGTLPDPTLELHDANSAIATNDNWKDSQQSDISATTIPPSNDLESAIVANLLGNTSHYTVILADKNASTGIGQVEVYDLTQNANAQLANISTRGFVDTGDNVMIGGVILGPDGNGGARILVRGIGPSLQSSGVANALQDPTLQLVDKNGNSIGANDNWKDDQQADIQTTGIPPADEREAAILQTLTPGNYTAILRGKDNTTGVGLVELYNIR